MSWENYYLGWDDGYKEGYVDAKKEYQPQWIPCSEKLPNLNKYVLCTVNDQGKDNEVVVMCLTTEYYWIDYASEYSWELHEVFAWMPLPEPYEKKEQ